MEDFLSSTFFRYALFPFASVALGAWVKFVSRNDQYLRFKKEDIAVGLDLLRTACLMFVLLTTDHALALSSTNTALKNAVSMNPVDQVAAARLQGDVLRLSRKMTTSGWMILIMVLGLWGVSTMVRGWGWASETELKPLIGVGIPLGVGVLSLLVVMAMATG
jgi:hypothetical protein